MPMEIQIPDTELFNSESNEFIKIKGRKLVLEHSLVSVHKWEAKWKKPFLSKDPKTREESLDYVKCMTLSQNVDPSLYFLIGSDILDTIQKYIDDPMTATVIKETNKRGKNSIITSELIYYWMVALQIPWEAQRWHLNQLLTLIEVCNIKNSPSKKMSKKEIYSRNQALNAARRKAAHSNG